jgi:lactoylglutathione lyase
MEAMRHFYETVMEFPLLRALSDRWIEYRVGSTALALTTHGARFNDTPP